MIWPRAWGVSIAQAEPVRRMADQDFHDVHRIVRPGFDNEISCVNEPELRRRLVVLSK